MKKVVLISPFIILLIICLFAFIFLLQNKDPSKPPSALIGKTIPEFETQTLFDSNIILSNKDLLNRYVMINFFASWCSPCKVEHPLFFEIKNDFPSLLLVGINHKDIIINAKKYLSAEGNPYDYIGLDTDGYLALDFGVFGLPETFLINPEGKIIYKHLGALKKNIIKNEIRPLLQ